MKDQLTMCHSGIDHWSRGVEDDPQVGGAAFLFDDPMHGEIVHPFHFPKILFRHLLGMAKFEAFLYTIVEWVLLLLSFQ